jgi:hypothetical protein
MPESLRWLTSAFTFSEFLVAAAYALLLVISYRQAGWRGGVGIAGLALVALGVMRVRVLLGFGPLITPIAYVFMGTTLLGQLLLPALWVHRMVARQPPVLGWTVVAGVAGYFLGGLIMSGVTLVIAGAIALRSLQ